MEKGFKMADFHFYSPVQVRVADLDTQRHVNNSKYSTYIEVGRFEYLQHLGLFDGIHFDDLGLIVADVHIAYLAQIELNQKLRVGVRTARIGNKSLTLEYEIQDPDSGRVFARAESVMVSYDYHAHQTIPVPDDWRVKITAFEGMSF